MGTSIARQRELWLKTTCLLVSVAMNVGLGLVGVRSFRPLSFDDQPMLVTLVERPAPIPVKPAADSSSPGVRKPAAAPRRAPPPATTPVAKAQPKEVQEIVPVAAEEGALSGEDEGSADASSMDGGDGTGWSTGWGGGRAGQPAADRLIKATPRIEYNATPVYPAVAKENRWEGTVWVRARVTAAGDVESVSLERSSGHEMLDRSALDSVRQWLFIPATRNGVPVASEASVQVPFRLKE